MKLGRVTGKKEMWESPNLLLILMVEIESSLESVFDLESKS